MFFAKFNDCDCFQIDPGDRELLPVKERENDNDCELAISKPEHQDINLESLDVSPDQSVSNHADSSISNRNMFSVESSDESLAISERSDKWKS